MEANQCGRATHQTRCTSRPEGVRWLLEASTGEEAEDRTGSYRNPELTNSREPLAFYCSCGAGSMTTAERSKPFLMETYEGHKATPGHVAELVDREAYEERFSHYWWREDQCPDCRNLLKHAPGCTNEKELG